MVQCWTNALLVTFKTDSIINSVSKNFVILVNYPLLSVNSSQPSSIHLMF